MKMWFLLLLLFPAGLLAQPVKKTNNSTPSVPDQKEVNKMMEDALKNLPPEQRAMAEQVLKDQQQKAAQNNGKNNAADVFVDESRVVPAKKTALISALPKKIMTPEEIPAYLKQMNASIATVIKPESKQMADLIAAQFKNDPYYGYLIASAASGLWIWKFREAATYLMGKAAEAIPNSDNLNNFASFLTMGGAAHKAIPILQTLNSIHKNNSTILNNLGQAWLQLGDETMGEKFLDSAIRIYPNHPQANYTKCLLLESRGKKKEAIEAIHRSLAHGVTQIRLNKLHQLEGSDSKPPAYFTPRVYYSSTFNLNQYLDLIPQNYALKLGGEIEKEWENFREKITEEQEKIKRQADLIKGAAAEHARNIQMKVIRHNLFYSPGYVKALQAYNAFQQGFNTEMGKLTTEWLKLLDEKRILKEQFDREYKKEHDRFEEMIKNGGDGQMDCEGLVPIINRFLDATNTLNQRYNQNYVKKLLPLYYNMYYYFPSTALTDAQAQSYVLGLRGGFLEKLKELSHQSDLGYPCSTPENEEDSIRHSKGLEDYDEVNCKTFNWIYTPGLGLIVMRCNTMSMHLNPILLPFEASLRMNFDGYAEEASVSLGIHDANISASGTFDENGQLENGKVSADAEFEVSPFNTKGGGEKKGLKFKVGVEGEIEMDAGEFKKGSVELNLENKFKLLPKNMREDSPVSLGMKNEVGFGLEISKDGDNYISDAYVRTKNDVSAKWNTDNNVEISPGMILTSGEKIEPEKIELTYPKAPSATVNAATRCSFNSGYSAQANSNLLKLK